MLIRITSRDIFGSVENREAPVSSLGLQGASARAGKLLHGIGPRVLRRNVQGQAPVLVFFFKIPLPAADEG